MLADEVTIATGESGMVRGELADPIARLFTRLLAFSNGGIGEFAEFRKKSQ